MILKKVKIYNYRQLQKVELDLQNSLTVLAGPNNSGKKIEARMAMKAINFLSIAFPASLLLGSDSPSYQQTQSCCMDCCSTAWDYLPKMAGTTRMAASISTTR